MFTITDIQHRISPILKRFAISAYVSLAFLRIFHDNSGSQGKDEIRIFI